MVGRLAADQVDNGVVLYMLLYWAHSSSIVRRRVRVCARSYGVTFTARTIQSSSPTSRIEIDAGASSKLPRNARPPVSA